MKGVIIISNYMMRYKGTYRLKAPYDINTNQFLRKLDGTLEDCDVYIECARSCQIYHYGQSILQAYIPSIPYGRSVVRELYGKYINSDNTEIKETITSTKIGEVKRVTYSIKDVNIFLQDTQNKTAMIFDVEETDDEVLFKFNSKNIKIIANILKAKTSGANISPFSSKNLPKNKSFRIPDEDLYRYKTIVTKIPPERILTIVHTTNNFLKTLTNKRNPMSNIKADMALKGLKGKEYIYSIGKWNEYLKYLEKNI